jgi:UDP-2,3-diacylglucosamine hydrolase
MKPKSRPDTILLISDLHLEPARPGLVHAFLHFLATTATEARALYILGDFFNVWVGDDDDTPLYVELSQALRQLSERGTAVYLMHGNRDFLLGERYAAACHATLITEPYVLEYGERRYLLTHGDALCTRDTGYMAFRQLVRNPQWQADFLAKPLADRRAFAQQARAESKSMSSNKAEQIMDVTQEEVEKLLEAYGISTLIHGHTHRPAVHPAARDTGQRIVLGDWHELGWCVRIDANGAALQSFPLVTTPPTAVQR